MAKSLVLARAGRGSLHRSWVGAGAPREWTSTSRLGRDPRVLAWITEYQLAPRRLAEYPTEGTPDGAPPALPREIAS